MHLLSPFVLGLLFINSNAFVVRSRNTPVRVALCEKSRDDMVVTEATSTSPTKSTSGNIDADLKTKLLTESIAPWRTVRLFLYGSLGSGALLGGFITLSGVAAALSGARNDVDLNTEYLNLAIDFGAVIAFALLFKFDVDKGAELTDNVEKKLESKRGQKDVVKKMEKREKKLADLNVSVQVSLEGDRQDTQIGALQQGAKQHIIVVIGPRKAIVQALLGASLQKQDFALKNILIVPFQTDKVEEQMRPSGGFDNTKKGFEDEPFVAKATGSGWDDYIQEELSDAVLQNGEKVKENGIVVVLSNRGKVIRRGVGKIPWRMIVDELSEKNKTDKEGIETPFL